ncbi:MAG TPA: ribosomal protein S18-alanine N-acetyltransferase [Terracidiphilus sp.]
MSASDLERVLKIAGNLRQAPQWPASAYLKALDCENAPRRIALVAAEAESNTLAGFLVARVLGPEAELETIAVAAEGQRQGVGGRLLRALVEELRTERVSELILEVRDSNDAALVFYRAHGFEETGRRFRYYADPEEDAILMRLRMESGIWGGGNRVGSKEQGCGSA